MPAGHQFNDHVSEFMRARECHGIIERAKCGKHQTDAQQETKIADAIDQKRFEVCVNGGGSRVPKANQQIRNQANRFPTEEQLQKIVRHHQHQHRKREQGNIGEEPRVAFIFSHIANGVNVHHEGNEGDHQHHHGGERID